ncbi:MAG: hypothetical protein ABI584_00015 [Acidobacteriota bacterium]
MGFAQPGGSLAVTPSDGTPTLLDLVTLVRHELLFHGLDWSVQEEIEQEIALWLVKNLSRIRVPRLPLAFASALVRQFLRSGNLRRSAIEEKIDIEAAVWCCARGDSGDWEHLIATEWQSALDPADRILAEQLLSGASWAEACEKAGVPAGSRSSRRARLVAALAGCRAGCER